MTLTDGGLCPARTPGTLTIIGTTYSTAGPTITYGAAPDLWDVYSVAGPGETIPSVVPAAGALAVSVNLVPVAAAPGWSSVGVSIDSTTCIDETNFAAGVQFTMSGDLGGCSLFVDALTSLDESVASDSCRGACTAGPMGCVAPTAQVTQTGLVTLPNMAFSGGQPSDRAGTKQLIGFRWRFVAPGSDAGAACTANVTISGVQLFGI